MSYVEFRQLVLSELRRNPAGCSWRELRERLHLPYRQPCPTWTRRMEQEDGLTRTAGTGRALIWRIDK